LVDFAQYNAIQLNDTHPVIAIPELMRILTAEHGLTWEQAWPIVRQTFAYTNHTIMAEALEKWDISIFQFLLPDILAIIERIDSQFREEVRPSGLSGEQIQNLAPLGDGKVRMAWLAIYSSHSVNGVAAMHSRILQQNTLRDFYQLWPERFNNKTNGVTPRRWLRQCNPDLAALLSEKSGGDAWLTDLGQLAKLRDLQDDETVLRRLIAVKRGNKERLTRYLLEKEHIKVDPTAIFDIQIKRLHEYKRQLLNSLLILDQYFQIRDNPGQTFWPCVYFFGAKAAPGYFRAKAIIKLINEIARLVNRDPVASRIMQVHFLPNYNVSLAQLLFPAADVSEQISTVGMEASGTGNMKFMMNGAVTLGTCDGANVEIAEAVGPENIYQFGCRVEDFDKTWSYYNPRWQYDNIPGLRRCIDALVDGTLSDSGSGMFHDLYNSLLHGSNWQPADPYYVLGDFDEYRLVRRQLQQDYQDDLAWARKCWINITSSGRFSSDRTIAEYAAGIWRLQPQPLAE
jgi:starch phosphorylase